MGKKTLQERCKLNEQPSGDAYQQEGVSTGEEGDMNGGQPSPGEKSSQPIIGERGFRIRQTRRKETVERRNEGRSQAAIRRPRISSRSTERDQAGREKSNLSEKQCVLAVWKGGRPLCKNRSSQRQRMKLAINFGERKRESTIRMAVHCQRTMPPAFWEHLLVTRNVALRREGAHGTAGEKNKVAGPAGTMERTSRNAAR